jgi:NitT/TauT family transport system ATP-binding protein
MQPKTLLKKPLIKANHLFFERGEGENSSAIFEDISFTLGFGETLAILGPSGCGKTSLLYNLAGLLKPTSGTILYHGSPLTKADKSLSVIFQNYGLLPWKKVWENVTLGLVIRKTFERAKYEEAKKLLKKLGIYELKDRFLSQLSEGQRQRVAIARSLLLEPDLLLMDEPFSSLDSLNRIRLQELLLASWHEKKYSLIMITHNTDEAVFLGQKILILSPSPGRIQEVVKNPLPLGSRFDPRYATFCQKLQQKLLVSV